MERNTEAKRRLDGRIADLDQRLKGLRALRAAMDDDAIAEEMAAVFASANGRKKPETASQSKNFKTIETFFRSRQQHLGDRAGNHRWHQIEQKLCASDSLHRQP